MTDKIQLIAKWMGWENRQEHCGQGVVAVWYNKGVQMGFKDTLTHAGAMTVLERLVHARYFHSIRPSHCVQGEVAVSIWRNPNDYSKGITTGFGDIPTAVLDAAAAMLEGE